MTENTSQRADKAKQQQWFDIALTNLRKQGRVSVAYGEVKRHMVCRYRSPDGCRCAIGWLIPDETYSALFMEGNSVASYTVWSAIPDAVEADWDFLFEMQYGLHDSYVAQKISMPYPMWLEEAAQRFAIDCGLTYTPLEGVSTC